MSHTYPRSFSHIGISVPNVEKAVEFYTQVMGWYTIMEPTEILEDKSPIGEMCTEVFGEKWEKMTIRCRTIGDMTCTGVAKSEAADLESIIEEVASTRVTERGGRVDDKRSEAAMEDRKKEGYF